MTHFFIKKHRFPYANTLSSCESLTITSLSKCAQISDNRKYAALISQIRIFSNLFSRCKADKILSAKAKKIMSDVK